MSILNEANALKEAIVKHRRYFHENAELHLNMPKGSAYVKERLIEMGYEPMDVGQCGVVALAGGKKPGKVFMIRADMDALPIMEENDLEFKCKDGHMHACGHDFHVSMLLGAAQIIKAHEDEICGQIKLMFQPGEETLAGAKSMIDDGLMENPKVDAAMMIHVFSGVPMPTGMVALMEHPMAASDWFEIKVQGKGCHGAMSNTGIDPINVLSHIHLALQAINSREVGPLEAVSLTVGHMTSGATGNIIPDTGYMVGTLRTLSNETRDFVKKRIVEISQGIASTFRATATVEYGAGCPVLLPNKSLREEVTGYLQEMLGADKAVDLAKAEQKLPAGMGSEDFAYVSNMVPGIAVVISAGSVAEGYVYPAHHPKVSFNEEALPIGAAVYAQAALEWLKNNK